MSVAARTATWRDLSAVMRFRVALEDEQLAETKAPWDDSPDATAYRLYETLGWLHEPEKTIVILVEDDGEPVGFALIGRGIYVGAGEGLSVRNAYIAPEARHGAATFALIRAIKKVVDLLQTNTVQAVTLEGNIRMRRGLRRLGFRRLAHVYTWERIVSDGPLVRTENNQEVHRQGSRDAGGCAVRPPPEPAVLARPTDRHELPPEA